jgi:hypothetical protein
LNVLLVILIIVDVGSLIIKIPGANQKKVFRPDIEGFTICDTCRKPDIFSHHSDEYAGYTSLKDAFDFDNADFENELKSPEFFYC